MDHALGYAAGRRRQRRQISRSAYRSEGLPVNFGWIA
jgi:hypothetical protein